MRHRKNFNHLSRKTAHRKAMLSNMACSLIKHKRIKTTVAKAKALRRYVEPLITKSKKDTTHSRRIVFKHLQDKFAVSELFRDIAQKIANRPGGYTRIFKIGKRLGDNADMCYIELVDYNESYTVDKNKKSTTKTRRTRRSKKTDADTNNTEILDTEKQEEQPEDKKEDENIPEDKKEAENIPEDKKEADDKE